MKKYISLITMVCVIFICGCKAGTSAANIDGIYKFDADAWKKAMTEIDPNFSNTPPELITKMVETFATFNMDVKGTNISANFGATTMAGTLSEVSKSDKGIVYKMTPTATDKQDQVAIFVTINGNTMVAGPEGNKNQLLYFKK